MTQYEIEEEIARLKTRKTDLGTAKADVQAQLSEIKAKIVGRMDNRMYEKLQRERAQLCHMVTDLERQITPINEKIRNLSLQKEAAKKPTIAGKTTIEALVAVRDEYQMFAADKTRVGSMRQMAAEFVTRLNPIIRKAMGPD